MLKGRNDGSTFYYKGTKGGSENRATALNQIKHAVAAKKASDLKRLLLQGKIRTFQEERERSMSNQRKMDTSILKRVGSGQTGILGWGDARLYLTRIIEMHRHGHSLLSKKGSRDLRKKGHAGDTKELS